MAFLGAGLSMHGLSQIGLRHYTTIADELSFHLDDYTEIQFYSLTDDYIASLSSRSKNNGAFSWEITDAKEGGLLEFTIEVSKDIDITFFNGMVVKFYRKNFHWFTGSLVYKPELDDNDTKKIKIEGIGFYAYLKDKKIEYELYENKTLEYIVLDIIENYIVDNLPIFYNPDLIDLPSITIVKYEIKNKDLFQVFKYLLNVANNNFNSEQYEIGTNKYRHFYFKPISNTVITGYFEGFHFQKPKPKFSTKDLFNKINVQRTLEGATDTDPVGIVEDTTSQEKYGIKEKEYKIPDYMDDTTALLVGNAILEQYKNPIFSLDVDDLIIADDPLPIGFYYLNTRPKNYALEVSNCDDDSTWDLTHISNTTLTVSAEKVYSGNKSFKIVTDSGSGNEYIEYELDEEITFPNSLDFYLHSNTAGNLFKITAYDVDGNGYNTSFSVILTNQFIKYSMSLVDTNILNLKKIRVTFFPVDPAEDAILYFDGFICNVRQWKQRNLCLNKCTYKMKNGSVLASAIFGEEIFSFVNEIKNIKDKLQNTDSIQSRKNWS
jgi:hypothetical protein